MADAIPIFAEGTFEEQIQELAVFIVKDRAEGERDAYVLSTQKALGVSEGSKPTELDSNGRKAAIVSLIDEASKEQPSSGSDKEIEGFWNLLIAHLLSLHEDGSAGLTTAVTKILQVVGTLEQSALKYRILSNFFNCLPRQSPERLQVYSSLLQLAASEDDLETINVNPENIDLWLSEWKISAEDKSAFLKTLVDAYASSNNLEVSYQYLLKYVASQDPSSSTGKASAVKAIAAALQLPGVLDFDPLFKLEAVTAVKTHELFSLLWIFLNEGLRDFRVWESSHEGSLAKYRLDRSVLERKIRLLSLASLAFKTVGKDLSYAAIASSLDIEPSEVENWVIDGIRTGLITGKLSQTTQSLHVVRATARTFEKPQWQALEQRLTLWKSSLASVLAVVANAQKNGSESNIPQEQTTSRAKPQTA